VEQQNTFWNLEFTINSFAIVTPWLPLS